jgi:hypothetical protein
MEFERINQGDLVQPQTREHTSLRSSARP